MSEPTLSERALRLAETLRSGAEPSLLAEDFLAVHAALARSELDERSWELLAARLPSIGWWRSWDRCERLRRAVIAALVRGGGNLGALLRGADVATVQYMVKSCLASVDGNALLSRTIQAPGATPTARRR